MILGVVRGMSINAFRIRRFLAFVILVCTINISGCVSVTELTVPDEAWVFEPRAVTIEIGAPADLNARSGRPHAITIGVFQLSDPNTFGALTQESTGAIELLRKGRIDDTVVDYRRITVQPGERLTEVLSRAEGARHIGVISGYFDLNVTQDAHLFKIPCEATGRGVVEKILAGLALIADEAKAKPAKIDIDINLGRSSVKKYRSKTPSKLTSHCVN